MTVGTLNEPGLNYHFLFWYGPKEPRDLNYKCKHTLSQSNIPSDELLNDNSLLIMKLSRCKGLIQKLNNIKV